MSADGQTTDPAIKTLVQDPEHDAEAHAAHEPHDQATEVAHAHQHFRENNLFFVGMFLPVILLTVIAFVVDFGSTPITIGSHHIGTGNQWATWIIAAVRSGCIAYFLAHLFKDFSLVFRTLFFTFIFLLGMIFLSLWDSTLTDARGHGIGNPIWDSAHPASMHP
jgi:hypothetical protein